MFKTNKESFLSQLLSFGIGPIIGMLISLVTIPITTRILLPSEFAKTAMYSLCQTIFYLVCLLGCDQAFVRFYNEERISRQNLFFNCVFFPMIFCIIGILFLGVFWKSVSLFLFGTEEFLLMILTMISLPFSLVVRFSDLKIRMDLRGKLFSFLSVFQQLLNFVLLILCLFVFEKSFKSIILSSFVSTVAHCCLSVGLSHLLLDIHKVEINWVLIKQFLYYGVPLVFASVLTFAMNSFDKVAIRTLSTFEELGLYSASFKIVNLVAVVQNIFTTAWTPVAYKWYESQESKEKYLAILNALIGVMLILFALIILCRNFWLLYLGSEYRNTTEIFVFLLFSPVMYTVSSVSSIGIDLKKKSIYTTIISVIVATINLIGNYCLVPRFGALGASITTAVSYLFFLWLRTMISNFLWEKYPLKNLFIMSIIMIMFSINMLIGKFILIEITLFVFSVLFALTINKTQIKDYLKR